MAFTEDEIRFKLDQILSKHAGEDSDLTKLDQPGWLDVYGFSSLDMVEVVFSVEDEFGTEFTDAEVETIQKASDFIALIQKAA